LCMPRYRQGKEASSSWKEVGLKQDRKGGQEDERKKGWKTGRKKKRKTKNV